MSVNVTPGLAGPVQATDPASQLVLNIEYNASSADKISFVADRAYRVTSIKHRPETAGTDAGAVTGDIKKAASGTAIASGTTLLASTFNLKATAATNVAGTLTTTTADLSVAAGTAIGLDVTGVMTAATGVFTITLTPA